MKSRTTPKFWRLFDRLPVPVQGQARHTYQQFSSDPSHPSINFKKVCATEPIYSVRISLQYRAVGLLRQDVITWFWIGHHDDYDRLLG